jgi:NADH-quinone oxidoreductase subunit G
MPKLTVNGKEVEVPAGTNLIEAAHAAGVEVPHYCYHPSLSIAGQCRLCMVDIEKTPRPTIACNTVAAEGMVVNTETDRVRETRKSIMEFHLINHPLDCPVCDQAGECFLQIYYMQHGLYDSRMTDEKVHKPKAVPLGPHVILDAERCILCSRCVRFCDEITHTGELGIFERGDHSEIGLFPGRELDNKYSANVVDICPVGALTDRDFRFQVRVWYLDTAKSICPGCARGCNIEVHVNRRRPHHAEGRRVARLKPRFNADVNKWWLCYAGRYGFGFVDAPERLLTLTQREGGSSTDATWEQGIAAVAGALRRLSPDQIGVIASPKMANEDLFALRRLVDLRGVQQVAGQVPPRVPGDQDDFLIRADKNPNSRGAELLGFGGDARAIIEAAGARRLKLLWIFGHDLLAGALPERDVLEALRVVDTVVFTGSNANWTSAHSHWVLPAAAWVEREGTYTNFEGRVQRFRQAIEPLGQALPEWEIVTRVLVALGETPSATRAEHWFRQLASAVPAFAGLSYQLIGDTGHTLDAPAAAGAVGAVGRRGAGAPPSEAT